MAGIWCTNCHSSYPASHAPFRCGACGGVYDYQEGFAYNPEQVNSNQPGIWKYRHTFGLPEKAPVVSLGEGDTPLIWAEAFGRQVAFKCEYLNPTGSFKDRGTPVTISFLRSRGVEAVVEDSSGNAGASFAAYCSRAGMRGKVFVPAYASGPKRRQIEAYGCEVILVKGPRSAASEAVMEEANSGTVYASHAYVPFSLAGYATAAYEIVTQLGQAPAVVINLAGHGSFLVGLSRVFQALYGAGEIDQKPVLVGVQARVCAPLWAIFTAGPGGLGFATEGNTLAEGVRVLTPIRGDALLPMVESSGGTFLAIEEEDILPGVDELARRGMYVEPTSAIVWQGLKQVIAQGVPDPIVVILTGSGLKSGQ